MSTEEERARYVRYKLNPIISELKGKKVLLVDDSIVRGNTSRQIVRLVRTAEPKEIYFASSAPPIRNPCFYGIDMQTRRELIAREKREEEIRGLLKADALVYQTLDGLKAAIGKEGFCRACFDGDYPTKIRSEEATAIEKERARLMKRKRYNL
jgi:amidophosphoribosyltransferase